MFEEKKNPYDASYVGNSNMSMFKDPEEFSPKISLQNTHEKEVESKFASIFSKKKKAKDQGSSSSPAVH